MSEEPARRTRESALIGALLLLLILAVTWPQPVVWINQLGPGLELTISEESFLGREAPEWDVAFWWIAGLVAIWAARSDPGQAGRGLGRLRRILVLLPRGLASSVRSIGPVRLGLGLVALPALVVVLAVTVDPLVIGWLTSIDQSSAWAITSLVNRIGGGVIPALTASFIAIVGVTRASERWLRLFVALCGASLISAVVLHIGKLAGRVRPELFLGQLELRPGLGEAFPSGHALSAFVVAGGIALFTRSIPSRVALFAVATAIAVTRVLTFRHFPSDVVFSAVLGLGAVWIFARSLRPADGFDETMGPAEP